MVYWGYFEFEVLPGHDDYEEVKGGFVNAFYKTGDVLSFLEIANEAFAYHKMKIKIVEWVRPYEDDIRWKTKAITREIRKLVKEAEADEYFLFDVFHMYVR